MDFFNSLEDWRKFILPSKSLFQGDTDSLKTLFDFIGVKMPQTDSIMSVLSQKLNAQHYSQINSLENHSLDAVNKIVGDAAKQLGYD